MEHRVAELAQFLKRLIEGESPDTVKAAWTGHLDTILPEELAKAEDMLLAEGVLVSDIQRANELHTDLVSHHFHPQSLVAISKAVRDGQGVYKGTVEVTEEISELLDMVAT